MTTKNERDDDNDWTTVVRTLPCTTMAVVMFNNRQLFFGTPGTERICTSAKTAETVSRSVCAHAHILYPTSVQQFEASAVPNSNPESSHEEDSLNLLLLAFAQSFIPPSEPVLLFYSETALVTSEVTTFVRQKLSRDGERVGKG